MALTRRDLLFGLGGGAVGVALSPVPWKLLDDVSIWTQHRRAQSLAYWDIGTSGWVVEAITYGVHVGGSSRDLPLAASFASSRRTAWSRDSAKAVVAHV